MENIPQDQYPDKSGRVRLSDTADIAWRASRSGFPLSPAGRPKIHLLIVDMQVDFCHPEGALFVPGAREDLQRLIGFIHRQAGDIAHITCSLDSHLPFQIFHPAWWVDSRGQHPQPYTVITCEDAANQVWKPVIEPEWSVQYTRRLRQQASKELVIWPYHCLIGSAGHALDPDLLAAVLWHAFVSGSQPTWWLKGNVPQTEHYSIIQPEICVPELAQGRKSQDLLDLLKDSDYIFVAGEAKSHCVLESIEDLVEEFAGQPQILDRIYVLEDCTSSIRHPVLDYESLTRQRFAEFARLGLHFVHSDAPLPF